jgi:hypothetical protein
MKKSDIKSLVPFVLLVGIFIFSNLLAGCGPSKNELKTAQVALEAAKAREVAAFAEAEAARAREAAAIAEAGRNKTAALILVIIIVPAALVGLRIHAAKKAKEKENTGEAQQENYVVEQDNV